MLGSLCSKSPEAFAEAETEAFKQLFACRQGNRTTPVSLWKKLAQI